MDSTVVASVDPERLENGDDKNFDVSAKASSIPTTIDHWNEPLRAVIFPKQLWPPGKCIIVSFLNGNAAQHAFVMKCWEELQVNLTFKYVGCEDRDKSDVRITFEGEGFKSLIGNTQASKNEATMTLGAKSWDGSRELRAHILHEGMHMLGFGHEHASPNSSIKWRLDKVYQYYKGLCGWDPKETRINVLNRYPADQVDATEYDPKSIMQYPVPCCLTQDGFCVLGNFELSELDKKKLKSLYADNSPTGVAEASQPTLPMASASSAGPTLAIALQLSRKLFKLVGAYCPLAFVLVLGVACVRKLI